MKIFCFGDSITWGAWDSQGGWAARLRMKIEEHDRAQTPNPFNMVYNCGISSDTSTNLIGRFKSDTDNRLLEGTYGDPIFIFCIGTNDCVKDTQTDKFWVEPELYKQNIRTLIRQAKEYSERIVFLGNMGVDESKTHPYAWAPDAETFNADIETYERLTQGICVSEAVDFIEVYSLIQASDAKNYLSDDGLHENDEGHEFLAEQVFGYISTKWL